MSETRKLTTILAADVVGYSRLAAADEERTLARLRALRSDLIDPTISIYHGRVIKRTGDGLLVEFRSPVEAVRCAIEFQDGMAERNVGLPPARRIEFRAGVHVGDVVEESDGDLMGNGVNIAARLEGVAEPGGICLSEDAYRQIKARVDVAISDLGEIQLKNITEPIRAFAIGARKGDGADKLSQTKPPAKNMPSPGPVMPARPSIAVLPFQNMSGDAEQEYFADGIVEEIITNLSQFQTLFVIARNSSFTYKGRAVDLRQVGRELGVRYVLEGSVRKSGDQVRITSQLIETETGGHLWADRFDEKLENVFELQDKISMTVVGQIGPKIEQAEIERAKRRLTDNLEAYDYYFRGMKSFYGFTKEESDAALAQYYKAIELDSDFCAAHAWAAIAYTKRRQNGWGVREQEIPEAVRVARKAVQLGKDDALALSAGGFTIGFLNNEVEAGLALIDRALALNTNLAAAWQGSGWMRTWNGEPEIAIGHLAHGMRLSPLDPQRVQLWIATASAMRCAGRYEEAVLWAEKAVQDEPLFPVAQFSHALSLALAGRRDDARNAMSRALQLNPALRVSRLQILPLYRRSEDRENVVKAARLAGMPE